MGRSGRGPGMTFCDSGHVPYPPADISRPFLAGATVAECEIVLSKPVSSAARPPLPAHWRDLLKRKKGVNLYIERGRVVWQFAYDLKIINAIKEGIKGRQWDPNFGAKGCWTCPLESLPDVIELYEHMGRTADAPLLARAQDYSRAGVGADAIKLKVQLVDSSGADPGAHVSIGRAVCAFEYDKDVIAAIKQIAPVQRSYKPQTKEWPIDLLAVPELLGHLGALQYEPPPRLTALAKVCERLETLLYEPPPAAAAPPASLSQATAQPSASAPPPVAMNVETCVEISNDDISDEALLSLDIDAIVASQASQSGLAGQPSQRSQPSPSSPSLDAVTEDEPIEEPSAAALADLAEHSSALSPDMAMVKAPNAGGSEASAASAPPPDEPGPSSAAGGASSDAPKAREQDLCAALKELHQLVRQTADGAGTIDRSDCGAAKRRKLTTQQKRWARGDDLHGLADSDYDDDSDDGGGDISWLRNQARVFARRHDAIAAAFCRPPIDCDCGQPHRRVGGRHVCRYFGYFHCGGCGNRWTSAYTWKGEQQACRSCNRESAPSRYEKLDGRIGMGNGKPHDSSRCSMCAQLGRDCSLG